MTRRKTTVLLGVALVAAAAFSFAYLRAHSTETLRGTYQGQSWKLSITRNWSPLCMRFTSTDGADTAACGFDKVERTGGAGGPAGSEVEFGPIPPARSRSPSSPTPAPARSTSRCTASAACSLTGATSSPSHRLALCRAP